MMLFCFVKDSHKAKLFGALQKHRQDWKTIPRFCSTGKAAVLW